MGCKFIIFPLCLASVFASVLAAEPYRSVWVEQPNPQFVHLTPSAAPFEKALPYFKARGVDSEDEIEKYIGEDLFHIGQALGVLFKKDPKEVLADFLGSYLSLLDGTDYQIDHVGRELYGPLSFYLPVLEKYAHLLGLKCIKQQVFPSTQVVKVLREQDPDLSGVTIARVYFQNPSDGKIKCVELFQASSQNERSPQNIRATEERLSLLTATNSGVTFSPIDHLSIQLLTLEEIETVHRRIQELASDTVRPYQKEISHNPGDGSVNTKVLLRDSVEAPFNKIIEFVHYKQS